MDVDISGWSPEEAHFPGHEGETSGAGKTRTKAPVRAPDRRVPGVRRRSTTVFSAGPAYGSLIELVHSRWGEKVEQVALEDDGLFSHVGHGRDIGRSEKLTKVCNERMHAENWRRSTFDVE